MKKVKRYFAVLMAIVLSMTMLPISDNSVALAADYMEDSQCAAVMTEEGTSSLTLGEDDVYVKFTPTEAGTYYFYTEGSCDTYATLLDVDGQSLCENDEGVGSNFLLSYECEADTSYYVSIGSFDEEIEDVSFVISSVHPNAIDESLCETTLDGEDSCELFLSKAETYVKFEPKESGKYYFYTEGDYDTTAELVNEFDECLGGNDDTLVCNFMIEYECEANTTYYLKISVYDDTAGKVPFVVSKTNPMQKDISDEYATLAEELVLDANNDGELTREYSYYKFVPKETGTYYIYTEGFHETNGILFDEDKTILQSGNCNFEGETDYLEYECEADVTYYLALKCNADEESQSYTITVSQTHPTKIDFENYVEDATAVKLEDETEIELVNGAACVSFTTTDAGKYYLYTTGELDTYGYLLDGEKEQLGFMDGGYGSSPAFLISYDCEADTTYYVSIRIPSYTIEENQKVSFIASASHPEKFNVPDDLTAETGEYRENIDLTGEYIYMKYVAEEETTYHFYTMGWEDTYACLLNSSKEIMRDSDNAMDANCHLEANLGAGETYYIALRMADKTITNAVSVPFVISTTSPYDNGDSEPGIDVTKIDELYIEANQYAYIAGDTVSSDFLVQADCGEYGCYVLEKDQYEIVDVKILDSTKATMNDDGTIQLANDIMQNGHVDFIVDLKIGEVSYQKEVTIWVVSFLKADTTSVLMTQDTYTLERCKMNRLLYDEGDSYAGVETVDLPTEYIATYQTDSESITVNQEGVVTKTDSAKSGDEAIVVATYSNGEQSFSMKYTLTIMDVKELPFEKPDVDCEAINVYAQSSSINPIIETFKQYYPEYADKINSSIYNGGDMSGDYKTTIDTAITAEDGDSPDIVVWDADDITSVIEKDYYITMEDLGITEEMYGQSYDYAKQLGSVNGTLKALTWQVNPGGFCYNIDIAKEVFGDASPSAIQEKLKDWDSFLAAAKELKEHGYKIVSGIDDIDVAALGNPSEPRVVDGTVYADDSITNYISVGKALYDNGYTDNTTQWSDEWALNMTGDVFGYFGPTWFAKFVLAENSSSGNVKWDNCVGPEAYYWGGNFMTATNVKEEKDLAKLFLYTVTCDEEFMSYYMKTSNDFVNNKLVVEDAIANNTRIEEMFATNTLTILHPAMENYSIYNRSVYDATLAECASQIPWGDDKITSEEEALEKWFELVKEKCPDLESGGTKEHTHTYGEWEITKKPSCSAMGEKVCVCSGCGHTLKEEMNKVLDHSFSEWKITKEAAYKVAGEKNRTCTTCKKVETEEIPALTTHAPHTFGEWKVTQEAKCDEKGLKEKVCTVCGVKETEEIPATGFVKGGEFDKGSNTYEIKKNTGKRTVVFTGTVKDNTKKVKVPKTVKVNGKTYTVTEIEDEAFKDNRNITSVTIESSVTKIGRYAFSGCSKLKTVTIKGSALTSISTGAFENCTSLKKITLPKNVKTLGVEAFKGCKNLKTITVKSEKLKVVGKNAIQGIDEKATINVPGKKLSAYTRLFGKKAGYKKTMKIKK